MAAGRTMRGLALAAGLAGVVALVGAGGGPAGARLHLTPTTGSAPVTPGTGRAGGGAQVGTGAASDPLCSAALLATAKQTVEQQLADRVTQLQTLTARIAGASSLPASNASTLNGIVSEEQTGIIDGGITGLQSTVPQVTTCGELIRDARTMVRDFRVFALVTPQVDLTVVDGGEAALVAKGTAAEPAISSAIAAAQQRGIDVTPAQQADQDLVAKLDAAQTSVAAIDVSTLLAQHPLQYPGNAPVLQGDRSAATAAATDLRAADQDLHTILQALS